MDSEATIDDLRLAIIAGIKKPADVMQVETLPSELFGPAEEPLGALYRVTLRALKGGGKPPSISGYGGI